MNFLFVLLMPTIMWFGNLPQFKQPSSGILYIGVENLININLNGCNPEDVSVKVSAGFVYKRDDSTFVFNPQVEGEELKLKLYYKKVLCEVHPIVIKKIPDHMLELDGENKGFIKVTDLNKLGKLSLIYPSDFPVDLKSTISNFNLMVKQANGAVVFSTASQGDKIDEATLNYVRKLSRGSIIVINNVITYSPRNGQVRMNITKEVVVVD